MKRTLSIVLLAVVLTLICISFSSCSTESKLTGNWICEEEHKKYPDSMTLNSDGTGTADGTGVSWWVEDDTLHLSASLASFSYTISFSGGTLYLDEYAYHKK